MQTHANANANTARPEVSSLDESFWRENPPLSNWKCGRFSKLCLLLVPGAAVGVCSFLPGPWRTCSRTCGAGIQQRAVRCRVLLRFSQTVADLPDDECEGVKPAASRPCYRAPCAHVTDQEGEELHDWEYDGFTECSQSCGGGKDPQLSQMLEFQTCNPGSHGRRRFGHVGPANDF